MTLVKNTSIYVFTGLINQLLVTILWILLAWWLAPSEVGIFSLMMFLVDFFGMINLFGLNSAMTRFYYSEKENSHIFNSGLGLFFLATFFTEILFFIVSKFFIIFLPEGGNIISENLIFFALAIFISSLASYMLAHYTSSRMAGIYAKFQMARTVMYCFLAGLFVYLGAGIMGVFYSFIISYLIVTIVFIVKEKDIISHNYFHKDIAKDLFLYGAPLMFYGILGVMVTYFSRLLMGIYGDLLTLGVYSFFFTLNLQINGLWSSFNRAWGPEVFFVFSEDKNRAMKNMEMMAFFISFLYLIGIIILMIFGELFLFKIILKDVYFINRELFYILLIQPLFTGIYTAYYPAYYYPKKTNVVLYVSIFVSFVDIVVTIFLVKFFGSLGASISYLFITIFTLFVYLFVFKKIMNIPQKNIDKLLIISFLIVLSTAVLIITSSYWLFIILLIIDAIFIFIIGKLHEKIYLVVNFLNVVKKKLL